MWKVVKAIQLTMKSAFIFRVYVFTGVLSHCVLFSVLYAPSELLCNRMPKKQKINLGGAAGNRLGQKTPDPKQNRQPDCQDKPMFWYTKRPLRRHCFRVAKIKVFLSFFCDLTCLFFDISKSRGHFQISLNALDIRRNETENRAKNQDRTKDPNW